MQYGIQEVMPEEDIDGTYEPYGIVNDFFHYTGQECMISGPYDTGKTYGAMQKLNYLMWLYTDLHVLVVRKTYSSLLSSAIETLYGKVLPVRPDAPGSLVTPYGGGTPKSLTWPTGSVMKFGGLDEPSRILSSEYDFIFVPQAEELAIGEWEELLGRGNGRAGHSPFPQVLGDCNPDVPEHWIVNRPTLKVFHTTHLDNPTLYARDRYGKLIMDENGQPLPTPGGKLRLQTLRSLTGLRYKRGYLGLWVGAEGAVYEDFDSKVHVIDRIPIPPEWKKYRVVDFGYTHPFVCQWWAMDELGKLYMYREMYYTGRTVNKHVNGDEAIRGILYYTGDEKIELTICDHDAEDSATMREYGIKTKNADKRIIVGIEKVQDRLLRGKDGTPDIYFLRDSLVEEDPVLKDAFKPLYTVQEMPGYVWQSIGNSVERAKDERPIKKGDHGMDAMRYMVMYFDGRKGNKVKVHRYA